MAKFSEYVNKTLLRTVSHQDFSLPVETVSTILHSLSVSELLRVCGTCKWINALAQKEILIKTANIITSWVGDICKFRAMLKVRFYALLERFIS